MVLGQDSCQQHDPGRGAYVVVTGGRPVGGAVELGVGDGDTVGGSVAEDKVLAANAGGLWGFLVSLLS